LTLLTVPDVAAELRGADTPANRALVSRLIADGQLEARRIGRRWYVTRACLDAYLAPLEHERKPAPRFARREVGRGANPPPPPKPLPSHDAELY
jgi:hypothetical protein